MGGTGGGGVSSRVKKFKGFRKKLRAPQAPFIFGRRRRPCVALERRRREKNDYLQLENTISYKKIMICRSVLARGPRPAGTRTRANQTNNCALLLQQTRRVLVSRKNREISIGRAIHNTQKSARPCVSFVKCPWYSP